MSDETIVIVFCYRVDCELKGLKIKLCYADNSVCYNIPYHVIMLDCKNLEQKMKSLVEHDIETFLLCLPILGKKRIV